MQPSGPIELSRGRDSVRVTLSVHVRVVHTAKPPTNCQGRACMCERVHDSVSAFVYEFVGF